MAQAYGATLEEAWTSLRGKDPEAQARNAGAIVADSVIVLEVLGRRCVVDPRDRGVVMDGREAGTLESIVVLHYLANASGAMPTGRAVSYRQLPAGGVFYGAFKHRVIDALGRLYDRDPGAVEGALQRMGAVGQEGNRLVLPVLPMLPVTLVLWKGDEEVPGAASMLFDETAALFLHIEDLAEVGTMIVDGLAERIEE